MKVTAVSIPSIHASHDKCLPSTFWGHLRIRLIKNYYAMSSLVLRVAARFVSIFGAKGKDLAAKINQKRHNFELIRIHYRRDLYPPAAPLPLLMRTRNLPQQAVISKNQDFTAASSLRQRWRSEENRAQVEPWIWKAVQNMKLRREGVGICDAASLWIMKMVAQRQIGSEEELKSLFKPYFRGFSAEVGGMQLVRGSFRQEMQKLVDSLELKIDREQDVEKVYALGEIVKHARSAANRTLLAFARTWGLQANLNERLDLDPFDRDKASARRFNELPKGNYWIDLTGSHIIAYLKLDFGSYFFDPNFGLMKSSSDSSQDLMKIRKVYREKEFHQFRVERYLT